MKKIIFYNLTLSQFKFLLKIKEIDSEIAENIYNQVYDHNQINLDAMGLSDDVKNKIKISFDFSIKKFVTFTNSKISRLKTKENKNENYTKQN